MHKLEALCVMLFVSYVCVSVHAHLFFSVEPADESCHLKIRDETNFIGPGSSFCWVYPTYTQFPCTQGGHLIFETHGQ